MDDPFVIMGLQISTVLVAGCVVIWYLLMLAYTLLWFCLSLVYCSLNKLVYVADKRPVVEQMTPFAGVVQLPTSRRRAVIK